jgi:hypothetical protein
VRETRRRFRKLTEPPSGLRDHVSRRDAATLLGFASEFNVRRLEKIGRLHAVRGAMGQAWYPRSEVMALRGSPVSASIDSSSGPQNPRHDGPRRRWGDAELVLYLRGQPVSGDQAGQPTIRAPRTIVDLVADTGISIARAERVYRFWLALDRHATAEAARSTTGVAARKARDPEPQDPKSEPESDPKSDPKPHPKPDPKPNPKLDPTRATRDITERRGDDRIERDRLIAELRDPDPIVRVRAFEMLRSRRVRS